jgi:hypothetical protein
VVYAPSERRVIAQLGKRMLSRAAVAFPVLDNNENPTRRVSTRVVINPKDLPRSELVGTYLLSHEITHVALARTAYGTPAWLQEGLADYVATRAGDPSIWYLAPSSVARAGKGVDAMPTSTYFGDDDPAFDYDLSLAACLVLAGRGGDARLWRFLSALDASADSAHPEGDADRVLRRSYGFDEAGLARRAARFLVRRGGS